jgi:hypothetical protein
MAKTYNLSTPVGKVRLQAAETDVATSRYTDEEIQYFLAEAGGDINMATAMLWEAKASFAANKAVSKSIGKLSVNKGVTAEYALKMAQLFRDKAGSVPYCETAEIGGTDFQRQEIYDNIAIEE